VGDNSAGRSALSVLEFQEMFGAGYRTPRDSRRYYAISFRFSFLPNEGSAAPGD
jgi:hypothetical protein